ncbi:MAG: AI-2E family transporter [Rikenellaceae bacterium]|nr:AI-2E family transporter [Rikenellaceae bacterium]
MSKLSKYIIGAAITAVVLFLVWYFSNVVAYILISAVLAIIGKPLVGLIERVRIRRRRVPRWLAALVTLLVFWAFLVAFVSIFVPLVFDKLNHFSALEIPQMIEAFREPLMSLQEFIERTFAVGADQFSLVDSLTKQITPLLNVGVINNMLSSVVSLISHMAVALFSITFITFFFLKEDRLFADMVIAVFPKRYEANIARALDSITDLLIRYFTGIVAESMIMLTIISVVLLLCGMPVQNAFVIGLTMGILNVVPYIGPLIGAGISLFIGMTDPIAGYSATTMALIIIPTLLVAKGFDDFVLQPALYSNRAKAHPLEIFLVILIAGSMAGVVGMLLAIPAYNVLRVFAKEFFNNFRLVQKLTEKM